MIAQLLRSPDRIRATLMSPAGIAGSGVAFAIVVATAFGIYAWHGRTNQMHRAEASLLSVTRALEHHATRSFAATDLVLRGIVTQYRLLQDDAEGPERLHLLLAERAVASPIIANIIVLDPQGEIVADSDHFPPRRLNVSDRPYFAVHRDGVVDGVYITETFKSRLSGVTVFGMSRRLSNPDGGFAGVVLATIDAGYFRTLYEGLDLGYNGTATLLTTAGNVLMRHPFTENLIGRSALHAPLFAEHLPKAAEGTYPVTSIFDGKPRLAGYKRLDRLPLVVTASYSMDEIFADWRRSVMVAGGLALVLATGSVLGCVAVAREVRRRRKAERLAQQALSKAMNALDEAERSRAAAEAASRSKSTFLAMISHELRTPLNAIIALSELLSAGGHAVSRAEAERYADDIHESGRHLLSLIDGLLDLSTFEAGRDLPGLQAVDLRDVLAAAIRVVDGQAQEARVTLRLNLPDRPARTLADPTKLRQAFINVIGNAVKFMGPGGTVIVSMDEVADGLRIRVVDTGFGMPQADIARVFEPFWQGDLTATRRHDGAGLGLAIARRLVEMHGGTIRLDSTEGAGTTVDITLPRRDSG